jgi:hypothetical protein
LAPHSGMMIGYSMTATVLAARQLTGELPEQA